MPKVAQTSWRRVRKFLKPIDQFRCYVVPWYLLPVLCTHSAVHGMKSPGLVRTGGRATALCIATEVPLRRASRAAFGIVNRDSDGGLEMTN